MLRRSTTILQFSNNTTTKQQQEIWSSISKQSRSFKPPALHVLFDTAANNRFSVATINHHHHDQPDSKSSFLLFDSPPEYTNSTNYNDLIRVNENSVSLVGLDENLTTTNDGTRCTTTINQAISIALKNSTVLPPSSSPSSSQPLKVVKNLLLTELDMFSWFKNGQRDVIMRNLEKNHSDDFKIVCPSDWAEALTSQTGFESYLQKYIEKRAFSIGGDESKHLFSRSESKITWNKNLTGDDTQKTPLCSPLLPKEKVVSIAPGESIKLGEREIAFAAETWCSSPVFEDLSTRSIFAAGGGGLVGFFPWMELFATPSPIPVSAQNKKQGSSSILNDDEEEYLPLLSKCMRSHPPFLIPFLNTTTSSEASPLFTSFDAATSLQLVQYLIQRSPQRLFLQKFGMLSPADEVLEKLEQSALELVDLQNRLAKKIISIDSAKRQQQQQQKHFTSDNDKSSSLYLDMYQSEKQAKDLENKTTERLMQCFFVGFNHNGGSAVNDQSNRGIEASLDTKAWNEIVNQRRRGQEIILGNDHNNNALTQFSTAMNFIEEDVVASQLTRPFLAGAHHLALGTPKNVVVDISSSPLKKDRQPDEKKKEEKVDDEHAETEEQVETSTTSSKKSKTKTTSSVTQKKKKKETKSSKATSKKKK